MSSDVVLGVFGSTAKARRVVPNKVVQGLAMGACVLTGDTPAVRRELAAGVEVAVCEPGDGLALAEALASLASSPERRRSIALAGRKRFEAQFSMVALAALLEAEVTGLVEVRSRVAGRSKRARQRAVGSA